MKAALRFEGASGKWSRVTNSAIHNGQGWGVNFQSSANIEVRNNVIFSFKPIGVSMLSVKNITFTENIVAHIYERVLEVADMFIDRRAAVAICSL